MPTSYLSHPRLASLRRWISSITAPSTEVEDTPEDLVLFADAEGEYRHVRNDDDDQYDDDPISPRRPLRASASSTTATSPLFVLCACIGVGWTAGLYLTYPGPTTVPLFIGAAFILCSWVVITCSTLIWALLRNRETRSKILGRYSTKARIWNGLATALVLWWTIISLHPSRDLPPPTMIGNGDRYFIAVNLYNSEAIMSEFITELTSLLFHLGRHDVYVSIYESNSWDGTKTFLHGFDKSLTDLGVGHRIITVDHDPGSNWPYGTSPERIAFLAKCRNKAMEPIQSSDDAVRISDWQTYTKVIFLNDIHFKWQDIVRLITTRVPSIGDADPARDGADRHEQEQGHEDDHDLACAMDYGSSGLYDTWVARDICGTPLRAFWPFVADKPSQLAVRAEQPFRVSACWNGAVVFKADPFLYTTNSTSSARNDDDDLGTIRRRGWKMVDDPKYPGARMSPPLTSPIQFRTSGIDACDHSECFLFSYDLHRLLGNFDGRPKIVMNPSVKVAYEKTWYHWNTVVLRYPIVQWWRSLWSHRIGYWLFDWPFEHFGRRRDYCTWAGLSIPTENGRCPPLPGPEERHWDE